MVKIHFTHSKLREQPFFAKNLIGIYQISKSRRGSRNSCTPLRTPMRPIEFDPQRLPSNGIFRAGLESLLFLSLGSTLFIYNSLLYHRKDIVIVILVFYFKSKRFVKRAFNLALRHFCLNLTSHSPRLCFLCFYFCVATLTSRLHITPFV